MGIKSHIVDAAHADREGAAVLEHILNSQDNSFPGIDHIGLKETISVACWYIWWIRRQRVREEQVPLVYKCKMSILGITSRAAKASKHQTIPSSSRWKKPEPRQVKLNVDASFHIDSYAGAVGAVLRDYKGNFIAASTIFLPYVASSEMAEALAMREGLSLASRMGCNNIVAESDSTEIVEACSGKEQWWNESAAIFADCMDLSTLIDIVIFKHCPREANEVAHELAKSCFSAMTSRSWIDEPPSYILDKLPNDVT